MAVRVATFSGTKALTTAYASQELTLPDGMVGGRQYFGVLFLYLSSMASTPTMATVKISRDSAGDLLVCPEFTATIKAGQTTATKGSVIVDYSHVPMYSIANLYVWIKLDVGTANLVEAQLTTHDN